MSHDGLLGTDASANRSALAAMQSFSGPDYSSAIASTLPSGSISSDRGVVGAEYSGPAHSVAEDGRARILKELEGSIESFRKGKTPKTDAIASILRILGENSDVTLTRAQKEAMFDSYLTEILSIQSTFDEPAGGDIDARVESTDQRPPGAGLIDARLSSRRG